MTPVAAVTAPPADAPTGMNLILRGEGRYLLGTGNGIAFEVDRLRRDRHELIGELAVWCDLPGAAKPSAAGAPISIGSFNLSSPRAREERARLLAKAARTRDGIDWSTLLEDVCQQVLHAERNGQPAVHLRDLERPAPDDDFDVEGFTLLRRHPVIVFGDGGSAKSYLALWVAGQLARRGWRTLYGDWEFAGEDHRERLERLFGTEMPDVLYTRCERPLVAEADRLRRIIQVERIQYAVIDSIAFAADGPPEAAEVAGAYFRAVRHLGIGTLHLAHVNRSEGADKKPFGSSFWHNGARMTWFAQRSDDGATDSRSITVGLYNRKSNTGPLRAAVGFELTFDGDRTFVERTDLTAVPELAARLSLSHRLRQTLRSGAKSRDAIAAEFPDEKPDSLRRTLNRALERGQLVKFPSMDGTERIGLPVRGSSED